MRSIIKLLAWVVGVIVVLAIAAVVLVPMFFDPNDHKDKIVSAVKEQTGRDLDLPGDIKLSVFPRLGVELGKVSLANAEGFGDTPMVSAEGASLHVALLPLVSKRIEADQITLKRPVIQLMTLADGRTNWEDLSGNKDDADAPDDTNTTTDTQTDQSAILDDLAIKGVSIEEGAVYWNDQRGEGTNVDVTAINLTTGPVALGAPVDVKGSVNVQGTPLPEALAVVLNSQVNVDLNGPQIGMAETTLTASGDTTQIKLASSQIDFDAAQSKAALNGLDLDATLANNKVKLNLPTANVDLNTMAIDATGLTTTTEAAGMLVEAGVGDLKLDIANSQITAGSINATAVQGDSINASIVIPQIAGSLADQQFSIDNIAVNAKVNDWQPVVDVPAAQVDVNNATIDLSGITVTEGDFSANADIKVTDFLTTPQVTGTLNKPAGSIRRVLESAAGFVPMSDQALTDVTLQLAFNASSERIDVSQIAGRVDGTAVDGTADINLAASDYKVDLQLGPLVIDDYLPKPKSDDASSTSPDAPASNTTSSGDPLKDLALAANLTSERLELKSADLTVSDLRVAATSAAEDGSLPVQVSALVMTGALPEPVLVNLSTTLSELANTPTLLNVDLTAKGGPLDAQVTVPTAQLPGDNKVVSLQQLSVKFIQDALDANVTIGDLSFDTATSSATVNNVSGVVKQADLAADLTIPSLTADINNKRYTVASLAADLTAGQPLGQLTTGTVAVDLNGQTLSAPGVAFSGDAGSLNADVEVTQLLDSPAVSGMLKTEQLNLRTLLDATGVDIEFVDPTALTNVSINTSFKQQAGAIAVESLSAMIDDTSVDGTFSMTQSPTRYDFDIKVGAIDLDRYLTATDTTNAAPAPSDQNAAAAVANPAMMLKGVEAAGQLTVQKFMSAGLHVENISITTTSKDDVLTLDPINADLYEGTAAGTIMVDVRGDEPVITAKQALNNIQIGPALSSAGVSEKLSGTGNLNADISLTGTSNEAIQRSMTGQVAFDLRDGAMKGFDLQKIILSAKKAYDAYKEKESDLVSSGEDETKFSQMSGTLLLSQGVASNNDLVIAAPIFRILGEGQASLIDQVIDYGLSVNVVNSLDGQGGATLDDLKNVPIPVKISGPFDSPSFKVDLAKLVKDKAKEKAKEKLTEKLTEKLGLPIPSTTQPARDTTQGFDKEPVRRKFGEQPAPDESVQGEAAQPEPAEPQDPEEAIKKKLKKKLLDKLFN